MDLFTTLSKDIDNRNHLSFDHMIMDDKCYKDIPMYSVYTVDNTTGVDKKTTKEWHHI